MEGLAPARLESGLVIIYKHAAHRLVQHRLQVVERAWADYSTLAGPTYFDLKLQFFPRVTHGKRLSHLSHV